MSSENDIITLSPREHVRMRPGMYIGGVDKRALHILVYEVMAAAATEILAGYGDHVWIILKSDNQLIVEDNGRGIPVKMFEK